MECSNITREPYDDDPLEINIPDSEGMCVMEGYSMFTDHFLKPLKINKLNIRSVESPKFANIRDYWDDETVGNITDLLHEFQDIFPKSLSK